MPSARQVGGLGGSPKKKNAPNVRGAATLPPRGLLLKIMLFFLMMRRADRSPRVRGEEGIVGVRNLHPLIPA